MSDEVSDDAHGDLNHGWRNGSARVTTDDVDLGYGMRHRDRRSAGSGNRGAGSPFFFLLTLLSIYFCLGTPGGPTDAPEVYPAG